MRQGGFYRLSQHFLDPGGCVVVSSCEEGAGAASAIGQASAVRGVARTRVEHPGCRRRPAPRRPTPHHRRRCDPDPERPGKPRRWRCHGQSTRRGCHHSSGAKRSRNGRMRSTTATCRPPPCFRSTAQQQLPSPMMMSEASSASHEDLFQEAEAYFEVAARRKWAIAGLTATAQMTPDQVTSWKVALMRPPIW